MLSYCNNYQLQGTVEVESSNHHDFEQASEPFTVESPQLPSHTGMSQGQWIPVPPVSHSRSLIKYGITLY